MSEGPQLDDLLGLLAGEGEFHSRGEFTLDPGRNREKIASLLSEDPLSWLYWWVRCGVSLEAHSCEVLVGRNALLARLHLGSDQPLGDFLQLGNDSGHVSLHYLRSALLWAQAWLGLHPHFTANLVLERPEQAHLTLALEADRVLRRQELSQGQNLSLTLALLPRQGNAQSFLLEQRRLLQTHLPHKVAYSPMPVTLDGQRLDGSLFSQDEGLPLYLRYYLQAGRSNCLGVMSPPPAHYYRLDGDVPRVWPRPRFCVPPVRLHTFSLAGELPPGADWSRAEGQLVAEWRTEQESTRLCAHPLAVPQSQDRWRVRAGLLRRGADNDLWAVVQHGIRLDLEPLNLGREAHLGWLGVIGLDTVQTDLSGLRLVRDSLYEDLHQWLRAEIAEIHEQQMALEA